MTNNLIALLCALEQEHEKFSSCMQDKNPIVAVYIPKDSEDQIPQSTTEYIRAIGLTGKNIRVPKVVDLCEDGVRINSGRFYAAFKEVYFEGAIDFVSSGRNFHPPSIPIIAELFIGAANAVSFEPNGPSIYSGGGLIAFDLRLGHLIHSVVTGSTVLACPDIHTLSQLAPLNSLIERANFIENEILTAPNKVWEINSVIAAMVNDSRPNLPLNQVLPKKFDEFLSDTEDLLVHFLVAHEYAHISCAHGTYRSTVTIDSDPSQQRDHSLELEADLIAFNHLYWAVKRRARNVRDCLFYLLMFFAVQSVVGLIRDSTPTTESMNALAKTDSHPDPMYRIANLLGTLQNKRYIELLGEEVVTEEEVELLTDLMQKIALALYETNMLND